LTSVQIWFESIWNLWILTQILEIKLENQIRSRFSISAQSSLRPISFSSLFSLHSSPWPTRCPSPSSSSGQCLRAAARSHTAAPCTAIRHPSPRTSGRIEPPSRSLRFPSSLGANPLTSSPVTSLHLKTHYRHPAGRLPTAPPPPRPYIRQLCLGHLSHNTLRRQTLLLRASTCPTLSSTAAISFSLPPASPRRHTNPWSPRWGSPSSPLTFPPLAASFYAPQWPRALTPVRAPPSLAAGPQWTGRQ
jgi:hypothetical protein